MTSPNCLMIEYASHTARLILNQPEKHNALDLDLIKKLTLALKDIQANPDVRIVILQANGADFCAGADLRWMQATQNPEHLAHLFYTLHHLEKPTIALVKGKVFGGGLGLVACCDIAVTTSDAQFCFSETKLGLIPAMISPYVIAAIGPRVARRYFLTTEMFDAPAAQTMGLIHIIAADEQLHHEGNMLIKKLLRNGPQALSHVKKLIDAVAYHPIDQQLALATVEMMIHIIKSSEAQEGFSAFFEKRPPAWQINDPDEKI